MLKKWIGLLAVTLVAVTLFHMFGTTAIMNGNTIKRVVEITENNNIDKYREYFDVIAIQEQEKETYAVKTHKTYAKELVSGVQFTNTIETNTGIIGSVANDVEESLETLPDEYKEEISVDSDVAYNPAKEIMNIDVTISDEEGNVQLVDVVAKPHINEDGSVSGNASIDGVQYEISDILKQAEQGELDECIAPVILVCIIVGAIIGGTIGGIGAYNLAKAQKKTVSGQVLYIVGGVVIGSVVGGAVGLAVGQLGSAVFTKLAALGPKITEATGFLSFEKVKQSLGNKMGGYQFHHLVPQLTSNIQRFGVKMIHNTKNIVQISNELHYKITGYYNSKMLGAQYGGILVREYWAQKSYKEQYEHAINILKQFAEEMGEKIIFN